MKGICGVGGEGDATKYMLRCGCEADTVFCVVGKPQLVAQVPFKRFPSYGGWKDETRNECIVKDDFYDIIDNILCIQIYLSHLLDI